ncbi:hypothetical protein F935_03506, partial [Acinetobacter calcoaceticus ANC 3811]
KPRGERPAFGGGDDRPKRSFGGEDRPRRSFDDKPPRRKFDR